MTMKRLLALLLAVLMMVTLFSACANDKDDDTAKKDDAATSTDDKKDDTAKDESDAPAETDPLKITYMGQESHNWTFTYEEALAKGFESINVYNQKMLEENNLICEVAIHDNESYKTTLAGYLAANSLYDVFISKGYMDNDVFVNAINNGAFADINEIAQYSDGTFSKLAADGGDFQYLRAWNIAPDGGWYYMGCADGTGTCMDLDNDEYDYLMKFQIHTWYALQIRRDWLLKVGLEMPTTVDEFHQALVAFREQDANGNGAQDERAFLGIGMATEQVFDHGTAHWYGLPRANFAMNFATGKIENPVDFGDQYLAFIDYTKGLYADQVAYMNEGGPWAYGANVAGNYASAQIMYPDNLITASTGDPDQQYEPLPIIQALEGVKPIIKGQTNQGANNGISFKADVDQQAAAAYLDWLSGKTMYMLLAYGVEGKTYEMTEDGRVYQYKVGEEVTQDEDYSWGDMWHFAPWGMFPQFQSGFANDPVIKTYFSIQEALDAGEPYTWKNTTREQWLESYANYNVREMSPLNRYYNYLIDFGTDNIQFGLNINFETLATDEETATISALGTDLTTYLAEMSTKYITGETSTDTYEEDLAYAYDTLGMQEYTNAIQAQVDRFLVAMGRDAILG